MGDPGQYESREFVLACPFQIIVTEGGVLLRRGNEELCVSGTHALEMTIRLLTYCSDKPACLDDILHIEDPDTKSDLRELVGQLLAKRFLMSGSKEMLNSSGQRLSENTFCWQHNIDPLLFENGLRCRDIYVWGRNKLSERIVTALRNQEIGSAKEICLVDSEALEQEDYRLPDNLKSIPEKDMHLHENDLCIAASPFGGLNPLVEINRKAFAAKAHFIPVIIDREQITIGPLGISGVSACMACVQKRREGHMADTFLEQLSDNYALEGQSVRVLHDSYLSLTAELLALELIKYLGLRTEEMRDYMLSLDPIGGQMTKHRVLPFPGCELCAPDTGSFVDSI